MLIADKCQALMPIKIKDQAGYTALEIILVLLVIAVLLALLLVYKLAGSN